MPSAAKKPAAARKFDPVSIVGIGASAGGLAAIERFLKAIPRKCKAAFLVVQHLDPDRPGALPQLLRRSSVAPVQQAVDGVRIRAGGIYIIPPGKNLSVAGNSMVISEPIAIRGLRLPIDFLFESLARERGPSAAGVLLSGMGHDGTAGLRAIRDAGGRTFAQAPDEARFPDMPRSAIAAGVVQVVAPAADIPGRLLNPGRGPAVDEAPSTVAAVDDDAVLADILARVQAETRHDFTEYKNSSILRRVTRRASERHQGSLAAYAALLMREPAEARALADSLLIGVTSFFRDPPVWEHLADKVLPVLLASLPAGEPLRAWVAGCSTGEEAYTLGMVLTEAMDRAGPAARRPIRIFATDIDPEAIATARKGSYRAGVAQQLSPERLKRFFTLDGMQYRVRKLLRELVVFAPHDLISDPPFTGLSLVSCRNVLIYMTAELQQKVVRIFHYSLLDDGVLVLGNSESVGSDDSLFTALAAAQRIFRRRLAARKSMPVRRLAQSLVPHKRAADLEHGPETPDGRGLTEQALLRHFGPPAVLVNAEGDILRVLGRTGRYLEPAAGRATLNVQAMARPRLRAVIADVMRTVSRGRRVSAERISTGPPGMRAAVKVSARRLTSPPALQGLILVAFQEQAAPAAVLARGRGQRALLAALQRAESDAASQRLENRVSREQLNAANEALQSINEELQSTNEELTTSTEEAQSMNEELQSVNAELQARFEILTLANSDLNNLLDNTDIAIVYLDAALCVRRFTAQMARVLPLIPGDVGRPLRDIRSDLLYADLESDARGVLSTLAPSDRQVPTPGGRWFAVRITPYRTVDDIVDGVVITFSDVSAMKALEARMKDLEPAGRAS